MNKENKNTNVFSTDELVENIIKTATFNMDESEKRRFDSDGNRIIHYLIYLIRNNVNGKIYVGQHITDDIHDTYMGTGKIIKSALKKYGVDNFTKTILFDFDTYKEMDDMERMIVNEEFINRDDTYNILIGGSGTYTREMNERANGIIRTAKGHFISDEKIEINREFQKEMYRSGKWKQRNKGKKIFYDSNGSIHYLGKDELIPNGWTKNKPITERDIRISELMNELHSLGSKRKLHNGDSIKMLEKDLDRWKQINKEKEREKIFWREVFEYYLKFGYSETVKKYSNSVKTFNRMRIKFMKFFKSEYDEFVKKKHKI